MKKLRILFLLAIASLTAVAVTAQGVLDPESSTEEGAVLFDGAGTYNTAVSPQAAAGDKQQLLQELKKRVTIDDHGDPAQRTALDSMLAKMMESPSAREVAAQFIKADAKVTLTMAEIPGSTVVTVEGKKTIWGTRGYAAIDKDPPVVTMNKLYMEDGVETGAATLAHEMLGHALEKQRAGSVAAVYMYNTDEEENARLIGWLVGAELNLKPEDETWSYMQDPEANKEYIKMLAPCYAIALTSAEMKDPVPVYTRRLGEADQALKALQRNARYRSTWKKIIDHFTGKHKMDLASFKNLLDEIAGGDKYAPMAQENIAKVKAALQESLDFFKTEEGKAFLVKMAKDADSEYFKKKDAVILERREKLSAQLLGKTPDSFRTPPAVGQVTWDQLVDLWNKDQSQPCAAEVFK